MSLPVQKDHTLRNGLVIFVGFLSLFFVMICFFHYQISEATDCSLLTVPSIYAPKDSNIGLILPGGNLTIQQTRDLCFDMNEIKKYEMCYYIHCGDNVNKTVNYQDKSLEKSLANPDKLHIYPMVGEKFTMWDVPYYRSIIIMGIIFVIVSFAMPIWMIFGPSKDKDVKK